jgi:hypothetical protein
MTAGKIALGITLFVVTFSVSIAFTAFMLSRLPRDQFSREGGAKKPPLPARIARNVLGLVLVALGVALSLPGIPGQGILTILVGIMLLDFIPGKDKLERKLAGRPKVFRSMNKMRGWFKKPAFYPPPDSKAARELRPAHA